MATLYTHQDKNVAKTWVLMALFLIVIVALGWFVSYYYQSPAILVFAVIVSVVMNVVGYWKSDKIVLAMYKAVPVTNESHPDLYNVVENLSITAGIPMPKVYVIPDMAPNAFATGRNPEHAAVAVTAGLLNVLNKTELEGVIAHEISHIGNRDTLVATIVVILVGFVSLLADFFLRTSFRSRSNRDSDNKAGGILMIVGIVFILLSPIIATLIQLAISRKREFLADVSGALLTRYSEGLASALEKINASGVPMARAHNATAHLFIANPFGKTKSFVGKLFMTHPPVEERLRALRSVS